LIKCFVHRFIGFGQVLEHIVPSVEVTADSSDPYLSLVQDAIELSIAFKFINRL
jgi:hypothetical protein